MNSDVYLYIVKRTQIYLDDDQARGLGERAALSGRTKSELIREAIDRYLEHADTASAVLARFHEAVTASAGAIRRLPPGPDYVNKLRRTDQRREKALDQRLHD